MYTYTFAYGGGATELQRRLHLHPVVCVASAIGRHVVGGERDVTIGQELAEDLGHHAACLCKLEDEVHVAGGLHFFSQCKIYFALTSLILAQQIFLSFHSKRNFLIFLSYRKFLKETKITLMCRWNTISTSYLSSS